MGKRLIMIAALLAAVAMFACACGEGTASMLLVSSGDFGVNIDAENVDKDKSSTGSIEVKDGDQIYIEPALEKGELKIEFFNESDTDHKDLITDFTVSGNEPGVVGIGDGKFELVITSTTDGTTGTVKISTKSEEGPEQWNDAETAEEAAEKAGLDMFEYGEGTVISLGEVKAEKIRWMEGVVRADIPIAAVDMWICKGLSSIDEGDISFDDGQYKHDWTLNVKGLVVTCYGNRKDEATKTIWTSGKYSYAIVAHGAGGDDDFGLSADDLSTLINSIQ